MATNRIIFVFFLICATGHGLKTNETHAVKSPTTDDGFSQCHKPVSSPAQQSPPVYVEHYIRPIVELVSNESEEEYAFSDPVDECRSCVVYSIQGHLMGIKDVVALREDPFRPDAKCKVSLTQIQAIVSNFQNIISGGLLLAAADAMSTADECQEALQNINTLSGQLMVLYKDMKTAHGMSSEEYAKLKNSYDEKMSQLKNRMDFITRQAEQGAKSEVDKANRAMDAMQKELNDTLEELRKEMAKGQNWLIDLVAYAIKDGKIKEAKTRFDEVTDKSKLAEIVRKAYDVKSVDKILAFSDSLPRGEEKAVLCETMVTEMKNDMESPMVLVVDLYVKALIRAVGRERLKETSKKLQYGVENVLNSFGSKIVNNNQQAVLEFARERDGILDDYVKDLVKASWNFAEKSGDGESGALKILDFVEELYSDDQLLVKLGRSLYDEMKRSNIMPLSAVLRIAHRNFKVNRRMSQLFWGLPVSIRKIVSGSPVRLSFFITDQYEGTRAYVKQGAAFAYKTAGDSQWIFESDDGKTFYIKSYPSSYYLYAASDGYVFSGSERKVFAWMVKGEKVTQGRWELRDAGWKDNWYYLWNKEHGEYLNAGEPTIDPSWGNLVILDFRKVFTWRKDGRGPRPTWGISWL